MRDGPVPILSDILSGLHSVAVLRLRSQGDRPSSNLMVKNDYLLYHFFMYEIVYVTMLIIL